MDGLILDMGFQYHKFRRDKNKDSEDDQKTPTNPFRWAKAMLLYSMQPYDLSYFAMLRKPLCFSQERAHSLLFHSIFKQSCLFILMQLSHNLLGNRFTLGITVQQPQARQVALWVDRLMPADHRRRAAAARHAGQPVDAAVRGASGAWQRRCDG